MEHASAKRQQTEEIREAKYSLRSLLLNGRNLSILMCLVFLWFLFDITHGFGMAPPYPSEWLVERESFGVDYWAITALCATVIAIWAVRRLCLLQKQFYDWALSGERYTHLKEYFEEEYWANVFKIFRANRTTILAVAVFVVVSAFYTVLWAVDPSFPVVLILGGVGFLEANDIIVATFFHIFMILFVLRPYSRPLANLGEALRDLNEETRVLKSSPVAESRVAIIDLVFLGKNKLVNPLDSDRLLGLESYRDYIYQIFALTWIFLLPDLIFFGLHYAIWKNPFFLWVFAVLAFINLVFFIYSYVVAASCCNEMKQSQRHINELMNTLMGASVQSGESPPALFSARTYILNEVRVSITDWRKVGILAVKIAIPILAVFSQYWKAGADAIIGILRAIVGE